MLMARIWPQPCRPSVIARAVKAILIASAATCICLLVKIGLFVSESLVVDRNLALIETLGGVVHTSDAPAHPLDCVFGIRRRYVWDVTISAAAFDDDKIPLLQGLPHVKSLILSHCGITDVGLRRLPVLPDLTWIALDETAITDVGISHLYKYHHLEGVMLSRTQITDSGFLAACDHFSHLKVIDVSKTRVTSASVDKVAQLHSLLGIIW